MSESEMIDFDAAKLKRLIVAHKNAVAAGDDTFVFDGHELVCGYAKYLIEYLEQRLGTRSNNAQND